MCGAAVGGGMAAGWGVPVLVPSGQLPCVQPQPPARSTANPAGRHRPVQPPGISRAGGPTARWARGSPRPRGLACRSRGLPVPRGMIADAHCRLPPARSPQRQRWCRSWPVQDQTSDPQCPGTGCCRSTVSRQQERPGPCIIVYAVPFPSRNRAASLPGSGSG